jgi:hypothetical protein
MTATTELVRPSEKATVEEWLRRVCTLVVASVASVASVAAYASYQHQCDYARVGSSDSVGAALWPLSVDGLLVLATVGVLKAGQLSRRGRIAVWLSFRLGIAMSLVANISAAPTLTLQPILVAGWPPVALLLAVELLVHGPRSRQHAETDPATFEIEQVGIETDQDAAEAGTAAAVVVRDGEAGTESADESDGETAKVINLDTQRGSLRADRPGGHVGALPARAGPPRTPTGAELDRVAGTNNYGRTVLRQWRNEGRLPPADVDQRIQGGVG